MLFSFFSYNHFSVIFIDNPNKDVYVWRIINKDADKNLPEGIEGKKSVGRGKIWLEKLDLTNKTEE